MSEPDSPTPDEPEHPVAPAERLATARATSRALSRTALLFQYGFLAIGFVYFLDALNLLSSQSSLTATQRFQARVTGVTSLVFYGLVGWGAGHLFRAVAALIDALVARSETAARSAELIEGRVVAALERLADTLERSRTAPVAEDPRGRAIAAIRQAIQAKQWEEADTLLRAFIQDHTDDTEGRRLSDSLAQARQATPQDLLAQLDAARQVNDLDRVFELHDALAPLLQGDPLRALDQELARWLMGLIQKRLRTGTMGTDVATLAARVADRFSSTVEGASLRASLPTLRRSAGLCPRCAQPYKGIEDACPDCLAHTSPTAGSRTPPTPPPPTTDSTEIEDLGHLEI